MRIQIVVIVCLVSLMQCTAFNLAPGIKLIPKDPDAELIHENGDEVFFESFTEDENIIEIDNDVFKNLDNQWDMQTLMRSLNISEPETVFPATTSIASASLRSSELGRVISNPQQAHCQAELQPVDLGLTKNGDKYYPTCIRLKRCSGCSNDKLVSCQPSASENIQVRVLQLTKATEQNSIKRSRRRRRRRRRNSVAVRPSTLLVPAVEHTQCEWRCILKETECDLKVQSYNSHTCQCICKNKDDEAKCYDKDSHYWDPKECQCLCYNTTQCSTSETFDHKTCKCTRPRLEISYHDLFQKQPFPRGSSSIRLPVRIPLK